MSENDNTMTTREVAKALGTSKKVVLENAKKCLPNKAIEHGKPTLWTEKEVTVLLEQMKSSRPNQYPTVTAAVTAAQTSLTPALRITEAAKLFADNIDVNDVGTAISALNAMSRAVVAKLEARTKELQITLDEAKEWASVKRMEALNDFDYSWKELKKFSITNGYEIRKAFDQNYGEVNVYHKDVWESVYGEQIDVAPWED